MARKTDEMLERSLKELGIGVRDREDHPDGDEVDPAVKAVYDGVYEQLNTANAGGPLSGKQLIKLILVLSETAQLRLANGDMDRAAEAGAPGCKLAGRLIAATHGNTLALFASLSHMLTHVLEVMVEVDGGSDDVLAIGGADYGTSA